MYEGITKDRRKDRIVVIYDIICDKRRRSVVKILEGYGLRVQKSAFELRLNHKQYATMITKLAPNIDENEDALRIYVLHANSKVDSWGINGGSAEDIIII